MIFGGKADRFLAAAPFGICSTYIIYGKMESVNEITDFWMKAGKKTERSMTILDAIIIGLCQCVATIPGLSRSGTTITAGIATGLRRDFAVKFSFLMSIPAVLGANILSLVDAFREGINWTSVPAYLVGMVVAMLSGIAAINLLRYISNKGKFGGFAYYCWVMGVLSIILYMIF